jgi:hypothetical protein
MSLQAFKPAGRSGSSLPSELLPIAKKLFWWGKPEEWLPEPIRFLAQVMTYGDLDDVCATLETLGKSAFVQVLDNPPPGVFDQKSWAFWHVYYDRSVPPMPIRKL